MSYPIFVFTQDYADIITIIGDPIFGDDPLMCQMLSITQAREMVFTQFQGKGPKMVVYDPDDQDNFLVRFFVSEFGSRPVYLRRNGNTPVLEPQILIKEAVVRNGAGFSLRRDDLEPVNTPEGVVFQHKTGKEMDP